MYPVVLKSELYEMTDNRTDMVQCQDQSRPGASLGNVGHMTWRASETTGPEAGHRPQRLGVPFPCDMVMNEAIFSLTDSLFCRFNTAVSRVRAEPDAALKCG